MQPAEDKPPPENSKDNDAASLFLQHNPHSPSVSSPDHFARSNITVHRGSSLSDAGLITSDQGDHVAGDHERISQDIDRFTDVLRSAAANDNSNPPEVTDSVEKFSKIIESRIAAKYDSPSALSENRSHKLTEEDCYFLEAVVRLSKLTNAFMEFPSTSSTSSSLDRTSTVLQKAMSFLEAELRSLLEGSKVNQNDHHGKSTSKNSSSDSKSSADSCSWQGEPKNSVNQGDDFTGYSSDEVTKMSRVASAMISAGYEKECCQIYSLSRRTLFYERLKKMEHEKLNMDDVWRMQWESLEVEIKRWINIVKNCSSTLFPGEKELADTVFADHPLISTSIFSNLARDVVIQLLDFVGAVAMTKRSAEKLFKFLDMYEALMELNGVLGFSKEGNESEHELSSEIVAACDRIGETATKIFQDLENSIKTDAAKAPVPGGAVHPLTRYVMNYLKYACEYTNSLEKIFDKQHPASSPVTASPSTDSEMESPHCGTRFSEQVTTIMDLLDANIETKSKLYKGLSLRYIFLMNNGRYVLQRVKGSTIHQVMGDNWCRRQSTVVRQFHKNYQRETWVKLVQVLNQEGLMVNGKVNRPVLKERFKTFNTMFDEIHKMQTSWVVSDEQLQSELRVSISAVVIPAYRSFLGRFRQHLDGSKHVEKHIKYQPEDLEALIEELFDGHTASMARKRT